MSQDKHLYQYRQLYLYIRFGGETFGACICTLDFKSAKVLVVASKLVYVCHKATCRSLALPTFISLVTTDINLTSCPCLNYPYPIGLTRRLSVCSPRLTIEHV